MQKRQSGSLWYCGAARAAKAIKDLLQAAAIIEWCRESGWDAEMKVAWEDAVGRGRGWKSRAAEGRAALT